MLKVQGETGYPLAIICRVLEVPRSTIYYKAKERPEMPLNLTLVERIRELVNEFPTYGYRRVWAKLRFGKGLKITQKTVHRIMRKKGWLCRQRPPKARPRVVESTSITQASNTRWAMDMTHIDCGRDGWGHLVAILDCADREVIGWRFAKRGRAQEAEAALEDACIHRFGGAIPKSLSLVLRSDNGLVFYSRHFRKTTKVYGIEQEYITPYTPEQNGLVERFFRSLKEECVYQHSFNSFEEAERAITAWLRYYNEERPHQALKYRSPRQYHCLLNQAA